MKYDVVIVGGGLGGLLCGYILSKHGSRVVVLEKNAVVGGCLQSFRRHGILFDTGMHYVGSVEPGQLLYRFWKYFDLLGDIRLRKLDEQAFDVVSYGGCRYPSAMGYEPWREQLARFFRRSGKLYSVIRKIYINCRSVLRFHVWKKWDRHCRWKWNM